MTKPIKVLYFVDRMLRGGIQSLVIDWVSRFDKDKIKVDFLLLDDGNKYELEETLKELGCEVYKLDGIWCRKPIDFIKYARRLDNFFKDHNDYKVVHMHSSSKNYMVLKYAKKYGVPIRIAHSHSTDFQTKNSIKKLVGNVMKKNLIKYATDYFACSKIAGEWLFGKKIMANPKFKIIHNSIDYDKFKFDSIKRKEIRKLLNLSEDLVVLGNVSRFEKPKNHLFLIDVFYEYQKINDNSKLVLIGTGSLEEKIKEKVRFLNIENKVIFTGYKSNVNEYMQAIDIFVMPSLCEGLGIVLIEAQASGMPCVASAEVIPSEAKVNENFTFYSLDKTAYEWAQLIFETNTERVASLTNFKREKYFLDDTSEELVKKYINDSGDYE